MQKYIMSLDSGTTSVRALVFDKKSQVISLSQKAITQYYPQSGWVEHDALEIWNLQLSVMQSAKHQAKIKSFNIDAVGITNQRETIVVWNKETGLPVYNAIVWQDRRTSEYCEKLIAEGWLEKIRAKTGLIINPYFSATKLRWILNLPEVKKDLEKGKLLAGTIDSWLVWKLSGGKKHVTDVSNASRTMLFNIHQLAWDEEILDLMGIPKSILPQVQASSGEFAKIVPHFWSNAAKGIVPITGIAGDQHAALFGQVAWEVGDVKNTYGTGCFTLVNTGQKAIASKNKLLTTIAWQIGQEKPVYALEGSVFVAGAALQWLRDAVRILYDATESDFYAQLVKDDGQRLYVVPAFTGLGAPYWDSYARGAIFGLERNSKREHLIKATLESIAYQSNDLIKAMEKDLGQKINILKVDGGASNSNYLMQFQSDISNLKVQRPTNTETTALGAGYLAGLSTGYWDSLEDIKNSVQIDRTFEPQMPSKRVKALLHGWDVAIKRTFNWVNEVGNLKDD